MPVENSENTTNNEEIKKQIQEINCELILQNIIEYKWIFINTIDLAKVWWYNKYVNIMSAP